MKATLLCICVFVAAATARAQQTVFNVPNADVLDKGKVYGELDVTYQHSSDSATFTPRVVIGAGHRIEAGLNLYGFAVPGKQSLTPAPTIKWKIYDGKQNGWSWLAGDDLFVPVQNRTYGAGDYVWSELAHSWESGTRVTFGAFYITTKVVAPKAQTGGQFAIEQPLNKRITAAVDWFTGDSSIAYVTPGLILKLSPQLTGYVAYQLGNHYLSEGNHQSLFELGWNFN